MSFPLCHPPLQPPSHPPLIPRNDYCRIIWLLPDSLERRHDPLPVRPAAAALWSGVETHRTNLPVLCVFMRSDDAVTQQDRWTPAEVRAWARQRGLGIRDRGRIPDAVIELYLAQPSTVRKWASDRGIVVSERGRLPAEVVEQYLARPAAVRAWALRQGIDVGERGRLPAALVERFLDRYRQLERDAA